MKLQAVSYSHLHYHCDGHLPFETLADTDIVLPYPPGGYSFQNGYVPGHFKRTPRTRIETRRLGSLWGFTSWLEFLCGELYGVDIRHVYDDPDAFQGEAFIEVFLLAGYTNAVLGQAVCAKLAKDVDAWLDLPGVRRWSTLCTNASRGGAIHIHEATTPVFSS